MTHQHGKRAVLLQSLYQWDLRGYNNAEVAEYVTYILLGFNETNTTEETVEELQMLLGDIVKKRSVLDEIIEQAAPAWPLEKMLYTDRNVLRLGIYELLFGDHEEVPHKVAINEAVELAKQFGGGKSNRFVNGVLGAVYKEIGEPGKDDTAKTAMPEVAYEDMPIEKKGAAVVYSIDDHGVIRLGLVHDVFGYWTLPKGGVDDAESPEAGTLIKVKEETNWDAEIIQHLGDNEYIAYPPEKGPTRKQVDYFLAKSEYTKPTLGNDSGGLDDIGWFTLDAVGDLSMYDDVSRMIIKSIAIITAEGGSIHDNEAETPSTEGEE